MKICEVETNVVYVPLERVFRGGTYEINGRCTLIVKVRTDEGVVGEIYSGDERVQYGRIRGLIMGPFRDMLLGKDPLSIEGIWNELFNLTTHLGDNRVSMRAISAIDMALWDLMGKVAGLPLWQMLGGAKAEIPIIGYTYYEESEGAASIARTVVEQKEQGYAGTKLKVGAVTVRDDIERLAAVRKAVGDDFIIACDANRAWTPGQAVEFARIAKDYGIAWLEEPVAWYNEVEGMRMVRQATSVPVTAGQSEFSGFGCMDLMRRDAVDYLNVDASMSGGVTGWKRIAGAATYFSVGMVHHEEPQVAIHLLSSIPHSFCAELFPDPQRDPVWHRMYVGHPQPRNGMISPPQDPGLGIHMDPEFVKKYRVG